MGGFLGCVLAEATTKNALKRYTAGAPIRGLSSERTKWAKETTKWQRGGEDWEDFWGVF